MISRISISHIARYMKRIYYFIQSDTDATDAALYIVRVGRSDPEQRAHASIKRAAARAPWRIFYRVRDFNTSQFILKLLEQNKRRALHVVSPVVLLSILKSRANADHVKNLSPQFLRRAKYELIQTHKLLLCENF